MKAVGIFMEQTKQLTDVQSDKVAKLAENIEYNNEEDFADKIRTIVENVSKATTISESNKVTQKQNNNKYLVEETTVEYEDSDNSSDSIADPMINACSQVISRTVQK